MPPHFYVQYNKSGKMAKKFAGVSEKIGAYPEACAPNPPKPVKTKKPKTDDALSCSAMLLKYGEPSVVLMDERTCTGLVRFGEEDIMGIKCPLPASGKCPTSFAQSECQLNKVELDCIWQGIAKCNDVREFKA